MKFGPAAGRRKTAGQPPSKRAGGWGTLLQRIMWRATKRFVNDDIPTAAASTTFYILLAFFPAVGAFVSLYGLFADIPTAREHLSYLRGFLPPEVLRFVGDEMIRVTTTHSVKLGGAFLIGLLISIWSANAGISSLMVGLNVAYQQKETRGLVATHLISLVITIAVLLVCMAVFFLVVAIPIMQSTLGLPSFDLLHYFRWPILFVGTTAMLAGLYRYGPNRKRYARRRAMFGAMFASAVWLLISLGFTWYVSKYANYDRTYGSLATMMGFMMWIWLGQMVILFGAELNSELEQL